MQQFLINELTLVADVSDGIAQAAVESLDWQCQVIREIGKDLGIEGADTIDTLFNVRSSFNPQSI